MSADAEVALHHQQQQARRREHQRGHHLPNRAVRAEKIGQRQHHRELHDFARLKRAEQRHLHPVFRAVVPLAEGQRQNQRADAQHHAQQRQPPKMVHMEDDFAHHQHHRQTQRVKHGLPRASRRRNGIEHHDAHAAEKIGQRHHQRIHRQKARKRQRGQQPQRHNRRAEHDGLHIRRALRFDGAEQQPQHLKHQSQQRDKRHARSPARLTARRLSLATAATRAFSRFSLPESCCSGS